MISLETIKSCPKIQITSETPSTLEILIETSIFDDTLRDISVSIKIPLVGPELVLQPSSVTVLGENLAEMEVPPSWDPQKGLQRTLASFIEAGKIGSVERKSAADVKVEIAIEKVKTSIRIASRFIARSLFFYIKGLDDDTIDRLKVSVIEQVTEEIINQRYNQKEHAGRKDP